MMPAAVPARMRWALVDGVTIVRRNLLHLKAQPGQLVPVVLFPVALVVLFGYVFGSAIAVPGGGNYREYLMPGLFSTMAVFSVMVNAMAIAADRTKGVMDRFRSLPIARWAVPFGHAGADIVGGTIAVLLMAVCGLVVGWRAHGGFGPAVAGFGLILLFRYAMGWVGIYLGLVLRNEATADAAGPLVFPITMISNTFVPTEHMAGWLRAVADWNPVSVMTAASRELFGNPGASVVDAAWPLRHSVIASVIWSGLLLAVFIPLSTRRYQAG